MVEKKLVAVLVAPEIFEYIENARGHERRSSFVRRIIVDWYNENSGNPRIEP